MGIPEPAGCNCPIAVNLTLRRLVGKVAVYLVGEDSTSYHQPQQLGVGEPCGAEAIVHAVHRYVTHHTESRDHLLANVDLSNAFNRVSQAAVLQAVELVCPTILPWVALTLCHRSHLYSKTFFLSSSSGVQQGDP